MPANGVPEPAQPKEAAPGVQIIEKKPAAAPAAPSAAPAAPAAPAMAVVDVGAINRAAQQQVPAQPRKLNIFCNLPFSIANMRHLVSEMRPQQPMQPPMQQFQQMPPQQYGYYQQPYVSCNFILFNR